MNIIFFEFSVKTSNFIRKFRRDVISKWLSSREPFIEK